MPSGRSPRAFGQRRCLVALVVAIAACAPVTESPTTAPAIDPSPASSPSGSASAESECLIVQAPGPGDEPPRAGGELDTADDGAGRWRQCLSGPIEVTVEGTAWCRWDPDRTAVTEVAGLPVAIGGVEYDSWLVTDGSAFEVHLTDRGPAGLIGNYRPGVGGPRLTTDAQRSAGVAAIDVALAVDDGELPPAGLPIALLGLFRWQCGDPPPPR